MRNAPVFNWWGGLRSRLRDHEPWWVEVFSGLTSLCWGIYVALDASQVGRLPGYDPIIHDLPVSFWATWAVAFGLLQFLSAALHWRPGRLVGSFMQMLLFKVLAVSIINSPMPGPSCMIYCGWAFADMAAFVRIAFRNER